MAWDSTTQAASVDSRPLGVHSQAFFEYETGFVRLELGLTGMTPCEYIYYVGTSKLIEGEE